MDIGINMVPPQTGGGYAADGFLNLNPTQANQTSLFAPPPPESSSQKDMLNDMLKMLLFQKLSEKLATTDEQPIVIEAKDDDNPIVVPESMQEAVANLQEKYGVGTNLFNNPANPVQIPNLGELPELEIPDSIGPPANQPVNNNLPNLNLNNNSFIDPSSGLMKTPSSIGMTYNASDSQMLENFGQNSINNILNMDIPIMPMG